MVDGAHPQRSAPTAPVRERQTGVSDEVGRAIDIDAMIAAFEKGIGDFGQAAVQRKMARQIETEAFASYPYARLGPLNSKLPSSGI